MGIALVVIVFASLLFGGGYASDIGLFAAAASMIALFVTSVLPRGRRAIGAFRGLAGPALLFAVVVGVVLVQLAAPAAIDRSRTLVNLLRLLGGAAIFLAATAVGRSRRALQGLTRALSIAGLGFVILCLILYATHPRGPQDPDAGRLTASFPTSPNTAAAVIGLIGLVALGGLLQYLRRLPGGLRPGERIERLLTSAWLQVAVLGLAMVTLGLTGSRSGVVLILLCAFALGAWAGLDAGPAARRSLGTRALGLLVVVAAAGVGAGVTLARMPAIAGDTASRTLIYQSHWPRLFDQPLIGHGLGSFLVLNRALATPANVVALTWVGDMHNVFMQWIEEMGFIGAGAMFSCIGWVLIVIARGAGRAETSRTWLKTVAAASLFLVLQGLVDVALQYESVVLFWAVLLGSGFGVATREPRPQPDSAS